jgi:monofunctional biosynthetic peptidoglycan transglycosylase
MAKATNTKKTKAKSKDKVRRTPLRWLLWQGFRTLCAAFVFAVVLIVLAAVINPPTTIYMSQESRRLGGVDHEWVSIEEISPIMARSVVAAEDANFCEHWGFDLKAIKTAIAAGGTRGASTISQQTVKNVFLWHGRNYVRKIMEALMTPLVEVLWSKRRIIEVYLNVAEFDEGVFGVEAAARHYFGVGPEALTAVQAARLAAILPSPKTRSASRPSNSVRKRASQIIDGAATIRVDGRSACFES